MARYLMPLSGRGGSPSWSDPFFDLHREMNRLFNDVTRTSWSAPSAAVAVSPRIDMHEVGDTLEISAEIPGVDRDSVELRLDGDVLSLRGEKKQERSDEQAHLIERSYGSFKRSIPLPFTPDPDKVRAEFQDGVLRVNLPRATTQEKSRRIEIGGASTTTSTSTQGSASDNAGTHRHAGSDQGGGTGQYPRTNQGGTDLTGTEAQGMGSAGGAGAAPETANRADT